MRKRLFPLLFSTVIACLSLQLLQAGQLIIDIEDSHIGLYRIPPPGFPYLDVGRDAYLEAIGGNSVVYIELDLKDIKRTIRNEQIITSVSLQIYEYLSVGGLGVYCLENSSNLTGDIQADFDAGYFPLASEEDLAMDVVPLPSEDMLLSWVDSPTGLLAKFDITEYVAELVQDGNVNYAGLIVASPQGHNLLYDLNSESYAPKFVVELAQIPEPSAYAVLLGVPLLCFVLKCRRRRGRG